MKRLSDLSLFHLENLQLILSLADKDIKSMSTFKEISEALKNDVYVKNEEFKKLVSKPPEAWQPIQTAPEGIKINTKIHDSNGPRNEQSLVRKGNLFFHPDMTMYVYYTPTHWKPL